MNISKIQVLVIDDHQLIIDGLKSVMQDEDDIAFAGGANNMDEAMKFLSENPVDVALVDINMPGKTGDIVTRVIKDNFPKIRILALTMHEDIEMISKMIAAGASGYLLKRTNMNEVLEAIRVVVKNGKYLGRDVQAIMMENLNKSKGASFEEMQADQQPPLTFREKEILNLVAKEMSNEEIAAKLFISERTVETHRRNIFTKTKTKSIIGLIKYAIKHGYVNSDIEEKTNKL